MKENNKKIIFNKEIDDIINGLALVLAFLILGIILQFKESFFGEATFVIKIVFIIIGIIGAFTEASNLNQRLDIMGFDNVAVGGLLLFATYSSKNLEKILKLSESFKFIGIIGYVILAFFFLLSFYIICEGIIQIIYSIRLKFVDKKGKFNLISSIIMPLSQIFSLILIFFQIYEIIFKK